MIESVSAASLLKTKNVTPKDTVAFDTNSFSNYLKEALNQVNQDQIKSEKLNKALAIGEVQDLHEVMIASQQASLSLQLAMQIRNKAVEAYQEIMRMQL